MEGAKDDGRRSRCKRRQGDGAVIAGSEGVPKKR